MAFGELNQPKGQPPFSHPNVNSACQWLSPKPRTPVQLVSVSLWNLKEWLTTITMTVIKYVTVHCSAIRLCLTLCNPMDCSMPGFPVRHQFPTTVAKTLQSCPTLCDLIDGRPPGSPVPGILQARTLEWASISFSNAWKWKVKVKSLSRVRLLQPRGL